MAQLLAGGMHYRFHRFNRLHMEGLRTTLAGTKFAQSVARTEFCEVTTFELQPSCGAMQTRLSQGGTRGDLFASPIDLRLPLRDRGRFDSPAPYSRRYVRIFRMADARLP